jgi:hypothetical protein
MLPKATQLWIKSSVEPTFCIFCLFAESFDFFTNFYLLKILIFDVCTLLIELCDYYPALKEEEVLDCLLLFKLVELVLGDNLAIWDMLWKLSWDYEFDCEFRLFSILFINS